MDHDKFRLLIFEVLEHHLDQILDCSDIESVNYHVDRAEWAVAYLKRYTKAAEPDPADMMNQIAMLKR